LNPSVCPPSSSSSSSSQPPQFQLLVKSEVWTPVFVPTKQHQQFVLSTPPKSQCLPSLFLFFSPESTTMEGWVFLPLSSTTFQQCNLSWAANQFSFHVVFWDPNCPPTSCLWICFFLFFWLGFLNFISQSFLKSSSLFSIFYFLLCPNCLLFVPLIILLLFLLSLDKKKQELAGWVIVIVPSAPFYFAPQL
jgi:hypothetical protein